VPISSLSFFSSRCFNEAENDIIRQSPLALGTRQPLCSRINHLEVIPSVFPVERTSRDATPELCRRFCPDRFRGHRSLITCKQDLRTETVLTRLSSITAPRWHSRRMPHVGRLMTKSRGCSHSSYPCGPVIDHLARARGRFQLVPGYKSGCIWTGEYQRKSLLFQFQWNQTAVLYYFARPPRVHCGIESMSRRAALPGGRRKAAICLPLVQLARPSL